MRNILRNLIGAVGIALSVLAAVSISTMSFSQVAPTGSTSQRQPVPRYFTEQLTHYIRITFNFNSCVQASNACTVKVTSASLPYNALVLRVTIVTFVAFNSTTSDVITVGTTAANANEIVTTGCSTHAIAVVACTVLAGSGNNTGNSVAQSGSNGGLDLFVNWTGGGGSPSAGRAAIVIEYIAPNDGLCAPVPQGATAVSC